MPLHFGLNICEGCTLGKMFFLASSSLLLSIHHLNSCVVQHLLPSIVKLPLSGVVKEPFLCQADGFLGSSMDTCSFLAFCLCPGHLVHGLVVWPGLLYAGPQLLRERLQVVGRVRQERPEDCVGIVQLYFQSVNLIGAII